MNAPSLFDQASRLRDLPAEVDDDEAFADGTPATVAALLYDHFTGDDRSFQALHDRLAAVRIRLWMIEPALLPPLDPDVARETGRRLVRRSTSVVAATVGLRLLAGRASPEDVPVIRTVGLLSPLTPAAIDVLETIPGAAADLVWLAERAAPHHLDRAVAALCRVRDPATFAWLLRRATDSRGGEVAQAVSLADLLEGDGVADAVVVHAGRLLREQIGFRYSTVRIDEFPDACRTLTAFAARAETAGPVLDLLASAIALADDLRTGPTGCLPWPPGDRAATLARLERLIASPRWAPVIAEAARSADPLTRWRAEWAARAVSPVPVPSGLGVYVVVPDPARGERAETRLLVDGLPVVAEGFRSGPPEAPERLLPALRAVKEPREVRLAEAWCIEGCCGALHVTIVREGDTVVWRDWRGHRPGAALTTFRFRAEEYDRALDGAVQDEGWKWPARTLADRLARRLGDDPGLLGRWECEIDGVHAAHDRIEVVFWQRGRPRIQFGWTVPVDETDLDGQVTRIVDRLRGHDPRGEAERLGFTWPEE
ncbi:hypothetical protein FDA94_36290 [Herbidospora galbida]|uniref:Uncharacterized protein n=1 Tax=Herbidospora galbida TaxID=2575442 RepID=A0A4U3LT56_9ACTN|nr:hypothetical protein [Herbidospora galbida]TKK78980.1 hypothetical protein FDA94_36290 [Herbidospora galbida]